LKETNTNHQGYQFVYKLNILYHNSLSSSSYKVKIIKTKKNIGAMTVPVTGQIQKKKKKPKPDFYFKFHFDLLPNFFGIIL